MVVGTNSQYFMPGVNQAAGPSGIRGLAGLGFVTAGSDGQASYGSWDFLQDITRGGLDIAKAVLTPPSYQATTGPGGTSTTTIRVPGASTQPTGSTTQVAGQVVPSLLPGISNTTLLLGVGAVALVMFMSRRGDY